MSSDLIRASLATAIADLSSVSEAGLSVADIANAMAPTPNPELGDLAFPTFPLAKALKKGPPQIAAALAADLKAQSSQADCLWDEVTNAGPYVNFRLNLSKIASLALKAVQAQSSSNDPAEWRFGASNAGAGRRVVIDYSSPNIAKPLGVHHLRSTMIGNSLKKIYEACGWSVAGVNHLGDWGTSFGKLIAGYLAENPESEKALSRGLMSEGEVARIMGDVTIEDLNRFYVAFSARAKADASLEELGKREFAALERCLSATSDSTSTNVITRSHTHSYRNFLMWERIKTISLEEFERVYSMLGVAFTPFPFNERELDAEFQQHREALLRRTGLYIGESFYIAGKPYCHDIIADARKKGLAVHSDGALVMFVHGPDKPPVMLLKDDGATAYHTRDMAAALYRRSTFEAERALYVVGGEQKLHFDQLFAALKLLGHDWADNCKHVDFGLVLAKDESTGAWGKFSTRQGKVVLLHDLLNEAIAQVKQIIGEKNPELAADSARLNEIASAVGVGAIVFNDLKNNRRSDVKFDWDEMLSFTGETGPYILYQYVRLGAVTRKFTGRYGAPKPPDTALLKLPHERQLVLMIAGFPAVVQRACDENEPSLISRYLLDVASEFSSYWTATKADGIVGDDKALSNARIALVDALRKVLGKGLQLLGLRLVEEM